MQPNKKAKLSNTESDVPVEIRLVSFLQFVLFQTRLAKKLMYVVPTTTWRLIRVNLLFSFGDIIRQTITLFLTRSVKNSANKWQCWPSSLYENI